MRTHYNKLVRDRIPEIMAQHNNNYEITTLTDTEYRQALLTKLIEEAQEIAQASPEDLPIEIADLYEVIDAILQANNLDHATIQAIQTERRLSRGAFTKRIILLWSETP